VRRGGLCEREREREEKKRKKQKQKREKRLREVSFFVFIVIVSSTSIPFSSPSLSPASVLAVPSSTEEKKCLMSGETSTYLAARAQGHPGERRAESGRQR